MSRSSFRSRGACWRAWAISALAARDGLEAMGVAANAPGAVHLLLTDVVVPGG